MNSRNTTYNINYYMWYWHPLKIVKFHFNIFSEFLFFFVNFWSLFFLYSSFSKSWWNTSNPCLNFYQNSEPQNLGRLTFNLDFTFQTFSFKTLNFTQTLIQILFPSITSDENKADFVKFYGIAEARWLKICWINRVKKGNGPSRKWLKTLSLVHLLIEWFWFN